MNRRERGEGGSVSKRKPVVKDDDDEAAIYEVTVWDTTNGDIVKKLWEATEAEVAEVEEYFANEPFREVVVTLVGD